MKNIMLAAIAALAAGSAVSTPAFAASEQNTQVSLCAAALDANGSAPADQYRAKFVKSKGAVVTTVTIKLVPNNGGEAKTGECQIKHGEVINAAMKA